MYRVYMYLLNFALHHHHHHHKNQVSTCTGCTCTYLILLIKNQVSSLWLKNLYILHNLGQELTIEMSTRSLILMKLLALTSWYMTLFRFEEQISILWGFSNIKSYPKVKSDNTQSGINSAIARFNIHGYIFFHKNLIFTQTRLFKIFKLLPIVFAKLWKCPF